MSRFPLRLRSRFARVVAAREPVAAEAPAPTPTEAASQPIPRDLFDLSAYRNANPDVVATFGDDDAVYRHYATLGFAEEIAGARPRSVPRRLWQIGTHPSPNESLVDRIVALEHEKAALAQAWDRVVDEPRRIDFATLSETPEDALVPALDRRECDEAALDEDQLAWRRDGVLVRRGLMPDELIDRYVAIRRRVARPHGWICWAPYMHVAEIRAISLYPPLMDLLKRLIGEEMGLHLNLTGWVSTDRDFHQDDFLNPPFVNGWYAGVWVALDDIHPDSGPFEYVPGSHRWPALRSHLVRAYLPQRERDDPLWPMYTERFLNAAVAEEMMRRDARTRSFIARKGDVLVWHGRLMHRGSVARVPGMPRLSLISHYSGLGHRFDMPEVARDPQGQAYFVHDVPLDVDPYALAEAAE